MTSRPDPRPGPEAVRLAQLFSDTMLRFHASTHDQGLALMNESGLTMPQIIALHVLHFRGACSVSQIAHGTGLSPAATSHLVERLVSLGMVDRTEDTDDRRLKRITLNRSGRTLVEKLMRTRTEALARALDWLTPATRAILADALAAIVEEVRARAPACAAAIPDRPSKATGREARR